MFRAHLLVHLAVFGVFLIAGWAKGFITWQLLVLNPINYPIALLCQLIGYKLGSLDRSIGFDHSTLLYAALSATFFYTVNFRTLQLLIRVLGWRQLPGHD